MSICDHLFDNNNNVLLNLSPFLINLQKIEMGMNLTLTFRTGQNETYIYIYIYIYRLKAHNPPPLPARRNTDLIARMLTHMSEDQSVGLPTYPTKNSTYTPPSATRLSISIPTHHPAVSL